jgi:hypothetical protein
MLWDYLLYSRTGIAEARALDASAIARDAKTDVHFAKDALERLVLVNRAMWELLAAKTGCTEQELVAKVEELDQRDGLSDGKLRESPRGCASCGRPLGRHRPHCLYCGARNAGSDPFPRP